MTRTLHYAHGCTAGATLLTAGACYTAIDHPWLAGSGLYVAVFLAWCAARLRADHRRTVAECEWARRRALGEVPPPLTPCCRLSEHADGTVHDHRCTDPFHGIVAQLHAEPEEHTS
ncbi:hypothetical protein [Streptomyces sp. NPDC002088]|uniref:hypothetical protein n=1 Tax=Streptomyces sp. NPDC002088 TaxID=3154665 RepID=UPI003328CF36